MAVWGVGPTATTVAYIKEAEMDIYRERERYGNPGELQLTTSKRLEWTFSRRGNTMAA